MDRQEIVDLILDYSARKKIKEIHNIKGVLKTQGNFEVYLNNKDWIDDTLSDYDILLLDESRLTEEDAAIFKKYKETQSKEVFDEIVA